MVKVEVKLEQLADTNWGTWAPRMQMLLTMEGYAKIVKDGLGAEPTEADTDKDNRAKAVIGAHVSDLYLGVYQKAATAKALWTALESLFAQKNLTRRLTLRRQLNSLKKSQMETLSMYFARATKLRDDLKGADQDITEDEVVSAVLAGLPKSYDTAIAIMEFSDKALTVDDCLTKLLNVEHKLGRDDGEPSAFYTRINGFKPSGGGGGGGHSGPGSSGFRGRRGSKPATCWHCGQIGHIKKFCRQLHGDGQQQSKAAHVSFACAHAVSPDPSASAAVCTDWLVDTGASYHMSPHLEVFTRYSTMEQLR